MMKLFLFLALCFLPFSGFTQIVYLGTGDLTIKIQFDKSGSDSLRPIVTLTNIGQEELCIPVFDSSKIIPRSELVFREEEMSLFFGKGSRFHGFDLESGVFLHDLKPGDSLFFTCSLMLNQKISKLTCYLDYAKSKEVNYAFRKPISNIIFVGATEYYNKKMSLIVSADLKIFKESDSM